MTCIHDLELFSALLLPKYVRIPISFYVNCKQVKWNFFVLQFDGEANRWDGATCLLCGCCPSDVHAVYKGRGEFQRSGHAWHSLPWSKFISGQLKFSTPTGCGQLSLIFITVRPQRLSWCCSTHIYWSGAYFDNGCSNRCNVWFFRSA